tara:strand:+ start:39 stop:515 length:477 start_codon:yes stop_codon:yes gene_type:complete
MNNTQQERYNLKFKWTVSKAVNTYGYNICTLLVNGDKVSRCNGGGYDMQGTCLGDWIEREFKDELLQLKETFYGLTFHDPNWQPPLKIVEREKEGKSLGLERYQDFYKQSNDVPTKTHTIPLIDGACGINSVEKILNAIGYKKSCIDYNSGIYLVEKI